MKNTSSIIFYIRRFRTNSDGKALGLFHIVLTHDDIKIGIDGERWVTIYR